MVVAERVDADAGDEIQVADAVLADQLHSVAGDELGTDPRIHPEQGRSGRTRGGHAGCVTAATIRVPAAGLRNSPRSPIRTTRAPPRRATAAARSLAAMPSFATPAAMSDSISVVAISGWATPPTLPPGMSDTNSSSDAPRAAATAAAASSGLMLGGTL